MAESNVSISGDGSTTYIGDHITVNISQSSQEEKRQAVSVILNNSGPTDSKRVSNCQDLIHCYCPREKIDNDIQKIQKGRIKTLHGTIGTGKTSAALHYIEVNKQLFSISWFVDVSLEEGNEGSINASLTKLAKELGVLYPELFETIEQKAKKERVIFLLDNMENMPENEWFKKLWNIRRTVYIIITTNNASLDLSNAEKLPVAKFEEALVFLNEIRGDKEDIQDLCKQFGWNILGLTAAKDYILKNKITAGEYLETLRDKEAAIKIRETERKSRQPELNNVKRRTLYTSVLLCLTEIDDNKFSAVAATSLISCKMIAEFLLSTQLSSRNPLVNKADLNDLKDQLKSLVHITVEHDIRFFSFHAYTQYVIRDMIDESVKADLLYKLAGIFVRYFSKDNRFSRNDFLQRTMREHAEVFLREWENKEKDDRTTIALARLSELLGFTYTQQQPPLEHKLDIHFERSRDLLHKLCGITGADLHHDQSFLAKILGKVNVLGCFEEGSTEREMYGISDDDLAVSHQLFEKLTKKSSELSPNIIEELVFSRTVNEQDFALFPEDVKENEELKKKIKFSDPLSLNDVNYLVYHGVAFSVDCYRKLFLPELYLSVIYSYGRNYFYKKRATMKHPRFHVNLLKLAYCLSREICKLMNESEAVLHEYLVQSNGLLYLLVNEDCVSEVGTSIIKKKQQVHAGDLKNAIVLYQQLIRDDRNFFEMGILKKTKNDKYSKLVCHQQILRCYDNLVSLEFAEDRARCVKDGVKYCEDLLEMLYKEEDLVRYSRHLNAIAKFYLSIKREEYYPRAIEIFTVSAEHAEKNKVVFFYLEALVGLAEVFCRIGKHRFGATLVSIRHLKQCNSKEDLREMLRQKPHFQKRIHEICRQNLATVATRCAFLRRRRVRVGEDGSVVDASDGDQIDDSGSFSENDSHDENSDVDLRAETCPCDGSSDERWDEDLRSVQHHIPDERNDTEQHPRSQIFANYSPRTTPKSNSYNVNADVKNRKDQGDIDRLLIKLAERIPDNWNKLAIFLKIPDHKRTEISMNHCSNVVLQAYTMLKYRFTSYGKDKQSWHKELVEALREIERNDLAQEVASWEVEF